MGKEIQFNNQENQKWAIYYEGELEMVPPLAANDNVDPNKFQFYKHPYFLMAMFLAVAVALTLKIDIILDLLFG